jgi:hypothetical protein
VTARFFAQNRGQTPVSGNISRNPGTGIWF